MNGWYIKSDGVKHELTPKDLRYFNEVDLVELFLPDYIKEINFYDQTLKNMIFDSGVRMHLKLFCGEKFTQIICPDNCKIFNDGTGKIMTRTMYNRSIKLKKLLNGWVV